MSSKLFPACFHHLVRHCQELMEDHYLELNTDTTMLLETRGGSRQISDRCITRKFKVAIGTESETEHRTQETRQGGSRGCYLGKIFKSSASKMPFPAF